MNFLLDLDGGILLFLQENVRNPVMTPILRLITTLGNGGAIWIALTILLLCIPRTRKAGCMALAALLGTLLVNNMILKNLVARTRPYEVIEGADLHCKKAGRLFLSVRARGVFFCRCLRDVSQAAGAVWCSGADPGDPDRVVQIVCGGTLSQRCTVRGDQWNFDQLWCGSHRQPPVERKTGTRVVEDMGMHFVDVKGILSSHNGMNLYRGCTHGCIYCDSRSACYQFTHVFEDIEVKQNAPELLERALRSKRKKCMIGTGSMCDSYMHCEEQLRLTRRCLELIDAYGFGVAVQTKSDRILRDLDLLCSINRKAKCVVQMTLTTYDEELCRIVEPNVCTTRRRFEVLKTMQENGIPTVVWLSPILPYINDTMENIQGILEYCAQAGVYGIICFGMGMTLRQGDREYYYAALDRHFPGLREKYHRRYGYAYDIQSDRAEELMQYFHAFCAEHSIVSDWGQLFEYLHEFPENKGYEQLSLF